MSPGSTRADEHTHTHDLTNSPGRADSDRDARRPSGRPHAGKHRRAGPRRSTQRGREPGGRGGRESRAPRGAWAGPGLRRRWRRGRRAAPRLVRGGVGRGRRREEGAGRGDEPRRDWSEAARGGAAAGGGPSARGGVRGGRGRGFSINKAPGGSGGFFSRSSRAAVACPRVALVARGKAPGSRRPGSVCRWVAPGQASPRGAPSPARECAAALRSRSGTALRGPRPAAGGAGGAGASRPAGAPRTKRLVEAGRGGSPARPPRAPGAAGEPTGANRCGAGPPAGTGSGSGSALLLSPRSRPRPRVGGRGRSRVGPSPGRARPTLSPARGAAGRSLLLLGSFPRVGAGALRAVGGAPCDTRFGKGREAAVVRLSRPGGVQPPVHLANLGRTGVLAVPRAQVSLWRHLAGLR